MVIWPMTKNNFSKYTLDPGQLALFTIAGIIAASPGLIIWIICKSIYTFCGGIISNVAFSKEEKVSIALGTIEKRG